MILILILTGSLVAITIISIITIVAVMRIVLVTIIGALYWLRVQGFAYDSGSRRLGLGSGTLRQGGLLQGLVF